ncbi:M15 family metallopeptidase [Ruania suaedae]|uniref:M15 family metallopeptidase n=1 Tax=Ruania suaedae TaxID=2897774 RepID=UPI001E436CFB|nr:M15 family metallopeptidase [Ruania suaedae]UFU01929.1 M15 family metallopeptidase [Ruania suaedae]
MTTAHTSLSTARRHPGALAALVAAALLACTCACSAADLALPESPATEEIGTDGGDLPADATVFDDHLPGIANLDPALRGALERATVKARSDGVVITITSGWRSADFQDQLLEEAIAEYGSRQEALRWVATAETSAHVLGEGIDIGPYDAIDWLVRFGAAFGLCQTYANESWHYELRPAAAQEGCPPPFEDPTDDPRMGG